MEQPAPRLCADRLDYGLRDAVSFGHLSLEDAKKVVASLRALPGADGPQRLLVLQDERLALALSRAYMACDRDVWGNAAHGDLYIRTARLMKSFLYSGAVSEGELWSLSDQEFWLKMREVASPGEREAMDRLEKDGLPNEQGLSLPRRTKVRTIDPDVCLPSSDTASPLSVMFPPYAAERHHYILSRQALYAPA